MVCEPGKVIVPDDVVVVAGATTGVLLWLSDVVAEEVLWIVATTVWVTAVVVAAVVVEVFAEEIETLAPLIEAAGSTATVP